MKSQTMALNRCTTAHQNNREEYSHSNIVGKLLKKLTIHMPDQLVMYKYTLVHVKYIVGPLITLRVNLVYDLGMGVARDWHRRCIY